MVYPDIEAGWLLALLIFLARVCDVSLGTFRVLVGFRGYRALATLIGFLESVIWLLAASQVIGRLDQWYLIVAYAAGFAAGNYVGITFERMLAMGRELVRVISYRKDVALGPALREHGYRVVELDGYRRDRDPVQVAYIVVPRRETNALLARIDLIDPEAIYTVTDVKSCREEGETTVRGGFATHSVNKRK